MNELNDYFNQIKDTQSSNFHSRVERPKGVFYFTNSSGKEFILTLSSALQGLKDIRDHRDEFNEISRYDEKAWRRVAGGYFSDRALNAMINVQTKPTFLTLSKIISWANNIPASNFDETSINVDSHALETAIQKLNGLIKGLSPSNRKTAPVQESLPPSTQLPKPFLLLAGISGTGKSRFVRKQAEGVDPSLTNFCLVPVRPDWHEPSDLLGYTTRLSGTAEYVATDVLRFLARAWQAVRDTGLELSEENGRVIVHGSEEALDSLAPYWLCLDEMNLAPVEQYFADYLSILETQEWRWADDIFEFRCDPILSKSTLSALPHNARTLAKMLGFHIEDGEDSELWNMFRRCGISLPPNLIVAGTVNMDETTHGFSRKVIDRALSLDFGEFFPNDFEDFFPQTIDHKLLNFPRYAQAEQHALPAIDDSGSESIRFLTSVNGVLKGTPFELAYRALNELLLAVICQQPTNTIELQAVWDDFLMQKVLPRIDGDGEKLRQDSSTSCLLHDLESVLEAKLHEIWLTGARPDFYRTQGQETLHIPCRSKLKLEWMIDRLDRAGFTSFWP